MKRITYIELAGEKYPLSFSLAAAKSIAAKYGDLTALDEALSFEKITEETIDIIGYTLAVLMRQGCAYMNRFAKDIPPEPDVHVEDDAYTFLSQDEIEMCIGIQDAKAINAITEAIKASSETEIEATSKKGEASKAE